MRIPDFGKGYMGGSNNSGIGICALSKVLITFQYCRTLKTEFLESPIYYCSPLKPNE